MPDQLFYNTGISTEKMSESQMMRIMGLHGLFILFIERVWMDTNLLYKDITEIIIGAWAEKILKPLINWMNHFF